MGLSSPERTLVCPELWGQLCRCELLIDWWEHVRGIEHCCLCDYFVLLNLLLIVAVCVFTIFLLVYYLSDVTVTFTPLDMV